MAARTRPPFRADHVGSLLRPPRLLQAREDHAAGRIDDDELRGDRGRGDPRRRARAGGRRAALGDRRRVPPRLVAHGLHLPARRRHAGADESMTVQFRNAEGDARVHAGRAARRRAGRARGADLRRRLRSSCSRASTTATPKLTIPSPSMVHYRGGRAAIDEDVYPDLDAFWSDLTSAYAAEVRGAGRPRLHLPAVRRHEPRLPQRPQAARDDREPRRRRRAPARALHPPHQRGARRPPGRRWR